MSLRPSPVLAACLLAALLAGCSAEPRAVPIADARRQAGQVQDTLRSAQALTADLLVRVKPEGGDALTFTLALWLDGDGRARLRASKLNFDFCDVLVQPDGTFTAVLARSNEVVEGNLAELLAPPPRPGQPPRQPFAGNLARVLDELRFGPLPQVEAWQAGGEPGTLRCHDPALDADAVLVLGADQTPVTAKTWLRADGSAGLRLDYKQWRDFDGLRRAARIDLVPAGGGFTCLISPRALDVVPTINTERFVLRVPAGAARLAVAEFARRLGE